METIAKVLRLFHQGTSVRQMAKQLNTNRRTINKYIYAETLQPDKYQRSKQHYPTLDRFIDILQ